MTQINRVCIVFVTLLALCARVASAACSATNPSTGLCASCTANTFGDTCSKNGYNKQIELLDTPELVICCVIIGLLVAIWSIFIWECVWGDEDESSKIVVNDNNENMLNGEKSMANIVDKNHEQPQNIPNKEVMPTLTKVAQDTTSQPRRLSVGFTNPRSISPHRGRNSGRAPSPSHDGLDGGARLINKNRNDDDPSYRHGNDTRRNLSPGRSEDSRAFVEPQTLTHPFEGNRGRSVSFDPSNNRAFFPAEIDNLSREPFTTTHESQNNHPRRKIHDASWSGGAGGPGGKTPPQQNLPYHYHRRSSSSSSPYRPPSRNLTPTNREKHVFNQSNVNEFVSRGGGYGPYYKDTDIPTSSRRSPSNTTRSLNPAKESFPDSTDMETRFPYQGGSKRISPHDEHEPSLQFASFPRNYEYRRLNVFPPPTTDHSR